MASRKMPMLTGKNLSNARKILFAVTELLDNAKIQYHLEGGTLLGLVRDQELLPWDHDVDISVPIAFAEEVLKRKSGFRKLGYRISVRKSKIDSGPIKAGDYSVIKIKPTMGYYIRWFLPNYDHVVLDIFCKTNDGTHTYWQAQEKIMRVESKFYQSFETIDYEGHSLKVPNNFRDYLTQKYGDWSVPVKEWSCGDNELTVIR